MFKTPSKNSQKSWFDWYCDVWEVIPKFLICMTWIEINLLENLDMIQNFHSMPVICLEIFRDKWRFWETSAVLSYQSEVRTKRELNHIALQIEREGEHCRLQSWILRRGRTPSCVVSPSHPSVWLINYTKRLSAPTSHQSCHYWSDYRDNWPSETRAESTTPNSARYL